MAKKSKEEKQREKEQKKENKRKKNEEKAQRKKEKQANKDPNKKSYIQKRIDASKKKTVEIRDKIAKSLPKDIRELAEGVIKNVVASRLAGMLSQVPAMGVVTQLANVAMTVAAIEKIVDSVNKTLEKTTDPKYLEQKQSRTNEVTTNGNIGSQLNQIPEPLNYSDTSGKAELKKAQEQKAINDSKTASAPSASSIGAMAVDELPKKKNKKSEYSVNKIGKNDYKAGA